MKHLKIQIRPDGEVEIEVVGVKGKQCMSLTKFLEDALGSVKEKPTIKSDFYLTAPADQRLPAFVKDE